MMAGVLEEDHKDKMENSGRLMVGHLTQLLLAHNKHSFSGSRRFQITAKI